MKVFLCSFSSSSNDVACLRNHSTVILFAQQLFNYNVSFLLLSTRIAQRVINFLALCHYSKKKLMIAIHQQHNSAQHFFPIFSHIPLIDQ